MITGCSHCRDLAPTVRKRKESASQIYLCSRILLPTLTLDAHYQWEVLAEVMGDVAEKRVEHRQHEYSEEDYEHAKAVELPVLIAKIDCVDHKQVCQEQGIRAYPSLFLFVNGERWHGGGYRGDRTVVALTDWLRQVEDAHKEEMEDAPRVIEDAHAGKSKTWIAHDFRTVRSCVQWS